MPFSATNVLDKSYCAEEMSFVSVSGPYNVEIASNSNDWQVPATCRAEQEAVQMRHW